MVILFMDIAHLKKLVNARNQEIDWNWEKLKVVLEIYQRIKFVTKEWEKLAD